MNDSHMPDSSHLGDILCESLFHPLKSPITDTLSALGAHTAKWTPPVPSFSVTWEPSFSYIFVWAPCLKR
jgi:hypothetical protein